MGFVVFVMKLKEIAIRRIRVDNVHNINGFKLEVKDKEEGD